MRLYIHDIPYEIAKKRNHPHLALGGSFEESMPVATEQLKIK